MGSVYRKRSQSGFTLIELIIVVVIVTILAAVGLPAYTQHVRKAKLNDAFTSLGTLPAQMDPYWLANHSFVGFENDTARFPADTDNFTFSAVSSQSAITVTATGRGQAAGFVYTIDQNGNRSTTAAPDGYFAAGASSAGCWIVEKGGKCVP